MMNNFVRYNLKPFLFSKRCKYIKVPYFYGLVIMILFITSVIVFLYMALCGKYSAGILGVVASVIATMAGLYFGTLGLYNKGKTTQIEAMKVTKTIKEQGYENLTKDI